MITHPYDLILCVISVCISLEIKDKVCVKFLLSLIFSEGPDSSIFFIKSWEKEKKSLNLVELFTAQIWPWTNSYFRKKPKRLEKNWVKI